MNPNPNSKLWKAIKEQGLDQRKFSKVVGCNEAIVSRVVNGWFNLDDKRKFQWAKALGRKPEELFPNDR